MCCIIISYYPDWWIFLWWLAGCHKTVSASLFDTIDGEDAQTSHVGIYLILD
jgi:hypothetical protein